MNDLIDRLNDEADQCRNDGADDIANLLCEAVAALRESSKDTPRLQYIALRISDDYWRKFGVHVMNVGGVGDLCDVRTFIDKMMMEQPLERPVAK